MTVPLQIVAIREERLDIGFVRPPITDASVASEIFVRESLMVALPIGHRLAGSALVHVSSLADERFVFVRREVVPIFSDLVLSVCRDAGFVPHTAHEGDRPQMVLGLVAAGMGISLVPASARKVAPLGVVLRPLQPRHRTLESGVAWRRGETSSMVDEFLKATRRVLARSANRPGA